MKFTEKFFTEFLNMLIEFDKRNRELADSSVAAIRKCNNIDADNWSETKGETERKVKKVSSEISSVTSSFKGQVEEISSNDIMAKSKIFDRLQKCKEKLTWVLFSEEQFKDSEDDKTKYELESKAEVETVSITIDDILEDKIDFLKKSYEVKETLHDTSKRKEVSFVCASFYNMCRTAEMLLNQEIALLRQAIIENHGMIHENYTDAGKDSHNKMLSNWSSANNTFLEISHNFSSRRTLSRQETNRVYLSSNDALNKKLESLAKEFCVQFPPEQLLSEYSRIYSFEPSYENYNCCQEIPADVHIGSLEYDITPLKLSEYTKEFLSKFYYFMYRCDRIRIPYCTSFGTDFNYLFRFNGEGEKHDRVVKDACNVAMQLFMTLPPGKVKFTFIDPVTAGESFAMFTRLVGIDDRTSEIINGQIWHSPSDIRKKLNIMINHISNVIQRCLQGKYRNIYEYNLKAKQNAEAYQVLMLMDFPAGLTDDSLKLLEQIITSGPKCGVFTVVYRNENQYQKVSECSHPLVENIEKSLRSFNYTDDCRQILYSGATVLGRSFFWKSILLPEKTQMDNIISTLKSGIKNADKVVIEVEELNHAERNDSTENGIRIPIGIHGANEIQYLTLGTGGSYHALIAGVAGSGKSSLLHTIILGALQQYSPDELSIYLVDFKRGVEFKIYADFILPSFKVVAIASEREFGYNILAAIEDEQMVRADLFRRSAVDKIEEYRQNGNKMPRILVIMDEFHELFSNSNDEFAKKSAEIMERIVRQGRAFGVHLILASQSYSNINGISRAVFDQIAVRILLKCSPDDANLLLDNGSNEIDQISIDDPGRAVYNSEAGNKDYNSHFRVAYIAPEKHKDILQEISDSTKKFMNPESPTRILLSNIEDNRYSIFSQFSTMSFSDKSKILERLYIGESLSVNDDFIIQFAKASNSNLLMVGSDTEKARSMFAFSILSLCIDYWIINKKCPDKPFITFYNCHPLNHRYFKDIPKLLSELLPEYVQYIACGEEEKIHSTISILRDSISEGNSITPDNYFFVFGYQRAEELKSENQLTHDEEIDSIFNITAHNENQPQLSPKDIFKFLIKDGAKKGLHVVIWQDNFSTLYQDDKDMMSYFSMRIAFNITKEEYSRFVFANESDISIMSQNNAIYYNKATNSQRFRPYQSPNEEWIKKICEKLK